MRSLTVFLSLLALMPITAFSWAQPLPASITPYDAIPMNSNGVEPYPDGVLPMTLDQVRVLMIQQSVAENPDCPCPYSPDRIGGQCGTNCLYYRPGGFRIKCFLKDISEREIYFWKLKYATPWPITEEIPPIIVREVPVKIESVNPAQIIVPVSAPPAQPARQPLMGPE